MNTEFDNIIKSQLSQVKVTPSVGLTKTMGLKLFLQNVKVFHKLKAFFLIGTVTAIGTVAWYSSARLETIDNNITQVEEQNMIDTPIEINDNINAAKSHIDQKNGGISTDMVTVAGVNSVKKGNKKTEELHSKPVEAVLKQNKRNQQLSKVSRINHSTSKIISKKGSVFNRTHKKDNKIDSDFERELNQELLVTETTKQEYEEEKVCILAVREANLRTSNQLGTTPIMVQLPETKTIKTIVKQFSIDAYGSFYGHSEIDNSIENDRYSPYPGDFYKETDAIAMQNAMGLNINYSVGTDLIRFKMTTGINNTTIRDAKAVYKHYEITDPKMLEFLNLEDVSWVNAYGEDSCIFCMYAKHTEVFDSEMKAEYNRYSYLNLPLKIGGELDFKYVSFSAQVGMQYSQLTSVKGIGLTDRAINAREKFYFWNELQVKALQEENQMIRTNYLSFIGSAEARVRLTSKFDLMGGYSFVKSVDAITNDEYIVSKKLKYSQFKAGITYYPYRNELNPMY